MGRFPHPDRPAPRTVLSAPTGLRGVRNDRLSGSSGKWRVRIRRRGCPSQTRYCATESEARAWCEEREAGYSRGKRSDRGIAEKTTLRNNQYALLTMACGQGNKRGEPHQRHTEKETFLSKCRSTLTTSLRAAKNASTTTGSKWAPLSSRMIANALSIGKPVL